MEMACRINGCCCAGDLRSCLCRYVHVPLAKSVVSRLNLVHFHHIPPAAVVGQRGRVAVAKTGASRMDFKSLVNLRHQVEERLHDLRATIEKQLEALGGSIASLGGKGVRSGRGSTLKGKKVPPKYRGASGETWAGWAGR